MLGFNKSLSRLWNLKIKCDSKEIAIHCKVYSELSIAGNCKSAQGFLGIAIQIPVCEAHIAADQCLKTIANKNVHTHHLHCNACIMGLACVALDGSALLHQLYVCLFKLNHLSH